MELETYDPTDMAFANMNPRQNQGDETLYVRFYLYPHQNSEKTLAEGRPIFEDREYIEIMVPGDKTTIIRRPIRQTDLHRFPKHYQAFKNNEGDVQVGTPLSAWPGVTRAQVEELKYFKVMTVEQLASIPDGVSQRFIGINMLKQKAKDFVEAAKGSAVTDQLRSEIESRDAEIAALMQAVEDLKNRVIQNEANTKSAKPATPKKPPEIDPEDR